MCSLPSQKSALSNRLFPPAAAGRIWLEESVGLFPIPLLPPKKGVPTERPAKLFPFPRNFSLPPSLFLLRNACRMARTPNWHRPFSQSEKKRREEWEKKGSVAALLPFSSLSVPLSSQITPPSLLSPPSPDRLLLPIKCLPPSFLPYIARQPPGRGGGRRGQQGP